MVNDSLHVSHLLLRAEAPLASEVGLSARISDALRVATRPSAWHGRVVLIRGLRVRLPERAASYQMTSAIEREWRRLACRAVEYVHASPASDVVWFADQIEARLALIERLADRGDVSAWYWRRLLPLDAAASPDEQLAALFAAPWRSLNFGYEQQMRFARMAFAALRSKARAAHVIARLTEAELRRLLPSLAMEEATSPRQPDGMKGNPRHATPVNEMLEDALIAAASVRERALRVAFAAIDTLPIASHESRQPERRNQPHPSRQPSAQRTSRLSGEGVASDWAGLLFILNLLPHVSNPVGQGFSRARPAMDPREAVGVMHAAARWLRIPPDEPIYQALGALNDHEPWPDVSAATVRALRVACLALTRRPLRRIVARRGVILISRTHLTTVFDLNTVRLDVRKAGLDLDPGWLPDLGRVVRFEYE